MAARPPGLFFHLVSDGLVDEAAVAPLVASLPADESFVATAVRGGEAFESVRWPQARDAALATFAARRCPDPAGHVAWALGALDACAGDPARLRALARSTFARRLAAMGADFALLTRIWSDATDADEAVFAQARWPEPSAALVSDLCAAHHEAADGLYAYHASRGIPGPAASSAAAVVRVALRAGLAVAELVDAARSLVVAPSPGR